MILLATAMGGWGCVKPGQWNDPTWDVVIADMFANGDVNLVAATGAYAQPNSIRVVLLADSSGENFAGIGYGPPHKYGRVTVGDVNKDGLMDVVALTADAPGNPNGEKIVTWWLSVEGTPLQYTLGEMSFAAGASCGTSNSLLVPSSVALGDVDLDGYLDIAVTSYRTNWPMPEQTPVHLLRFDHDAGTFQKQGDLCGWGAMRARFHDMDGDGHPDLVTSLQWVGDPGIQMEKKGEWAQWWPSGKGALTGSSWKPKPLAIKGIVNDDVQMAAVDFSMVKAGQNTRFAVALSAHQCATGACWADTTSGGYVVVSDYPPSAAGGPSNTGPLVWSSRSLESQYTSAHPSSRTLVPSAVQFLRGAAPEGLLIGYWFYSLADLNAKAFPTPGPYLLTKGSFGGDPDADPAFGTFTGEAHVTEAIAQFRPPAPGKVHFAVADAQGGIHILELDRP